MFRRPKVWMAVWTGARSAQPDVQTLPVLLMSKSPSGSRICGQQHSPHPHHASHRMQARKKAIQIHSLCRLMLSLESFGYCGGMSRPSLRMRFPGEVPPRLQDRLREFLASPMGQDASRPLLLSLHGSAVGSSTDDALCRMIAGGRARWALGKEYGTCLILLPCD